MGTYSAYSGASGISSCLTCPLRSFSPAPGSHYCEWLPANAFNATLTTAPRSLTFLTRPSGERHLVPTDAAPAFMPCPSGWFSVPGPFYDGCLELPEAWFLTITNPATVDIQVRDTHWNFCAHATVPAMPSWSDLNSRCSFSGLPSLCIFCIDSADCVRFRRRCDLRSQTTLCCDSNSHHYIVSCGNFCSARSDFVRLRVPQLRAPSLAGFLAQDEAY
jgi:hypothetical protein